jgi:hypothetical protein
MITGLLMRGVLVGTKQINDKWKNQDGVWVDKFVTVVGIETEFTNGFGRVQKYTQELHLFENKLNDAAFMQSLVENNQNLVEIPCFVHYRKIVVEGTAVLNVIDNTDFQRAS